MPLMDDNGQALELGAYVEAVVPTAGGLAFATTEGQVAFGATPPRRIHDGGILCAAAFDGGIATGGDDGCVKLVKADGTVIDVAELPGKWIEKMAASDGGGIAFATGKTVHVARPVKGIFRTIAHEHTVQSLAFDPKGKRLAVAHYNGVSLWWVNSDASKPMVLGWKGAHTLVTWSPDGKFVMTAMQENALHGWRLADLADMRMGGYPSKTKSFAWVDKGRYLATSGAEAVVLWPFTDKNGPMGKSGLQRFGLGALCTAVAAHPKQGILAAGFADGAVLLYRTDDEMEVLVAGRTDEEVPVTAIAFSRDGKQLGFGREDGTGGLVELPG